MDVKTYKKTATIDAVQWDGSTNSTSFIHRWSRGTVVPDVSYMDSDVGKQVLRVPTLEGPIFASVGDYIAKGINDEFWPIKPDIMEKTYQEV